MKCGIRSDIAHYTGCSEIQGTLDGDKIKSMKHSKNDCRHTGGCTDCIQEIEKTTRVYTYNYTVTNEMLDAKLNEIIDKLNNI